ncbi:hypothetical protein F5Y15DRAFT_404682 [Xylariaceae sp. FL0016]|nr:hypothetical protein F5Y15DRAFT_404682 [Xylariaceae sp. FL0016]
MRPLLIPLLFLPTSTAASRLIRPTAPATLNPQPPCPISLLEEATSRYLLSQSTGNPRWLDRLLAPNATLLENNTPVPRSTSLLNTALPIASVHHRYDPVACATYTELISLGTPSDRIIGTQLRLTPGSSSSTGFTRNATTTTTAKIAKIDSIVTGPGDLYFNATHTLHYALLEPWTPIPPSERDTREVLQAAADAYYAVFSNNSTVVPWGSPCVRLEGGAYIGVGAGENGTDSCNTGLPPFAVTMPDRRYVIDEEMGMVNILSDFGILGPDSHEFRIEGGRIRYIHAMSFCQGTPNCNAPDHPGLTDDVGY